MVIKWFCFLTLQGSLFPEELWRWERQAWCHIHLLLCCTNLVHAQMTRMVCSTMKHNEMCRPTSTRLTRQQWQHVTDVIVSSMSDTSACGSVNIASPTILSGLSIFWAIVVRISCCEQTAGRQGQLPDGWNVLEMTTLAINNSMWKFNRYNPLNLIIANCPMQPIQAATDKESWLFKSLLGEA